MTQEGITVIVVEDETLVRLYIVMSLENEGFVVLEASNSDEAIDILNTHPEIRLMFTDIDMPGSMDGLKLAAAVRDRWPPVKIIVASGHRQLSDELLPVEGRFFSKPYEHGRIIGAMREMLAVA
ncbi:response regulator (plasmid) [Rhizobium leguminosarum]|uniref:Response regulator n=2 Tax=Rhizobium leguminosarum TaxID=384 RepID=A0A4Q8XND7_RHILE|nr:response regulator [Rhizobium leguminosarum]TAX22869.1 response regulator [Rhizobium leguminosarum]TAX45704.1 response regulator [Rhizobium leguminosarum]TAX46579.1 response regulator [Rhizobium leguminosarum]TAX63813.1 response regulator [Rhizobium leguminosarum]TAY05893.1 response regulator [Rhizobium leguminosarum]